MFVVSGLRREVFGPLFGMSDDELGRVGASRVVADRADAYPCRIGLRRVEVGEELLLVNHEHQPVGSSPYRAKGPIFVGTASEGPVRVEDELAPIMRDRILSLRAYDEAAWIVDAEVAENAGAEAAIRRMLAAPGTAYVHAHFAGRGCYAARIDRA